MWGAGDGVSYQIEAIAPMRTAAHAVTVAHPAVIETRPESTPLHIADTSHVFPLPRMRSSTTVHMPLVDAARVVVHTTRAAVDADEPVIESVEPALKPYQPSQRIIVPSTWSTCEWPRMWIAGPRRPLTVIAKRPRRGPMIAAPTRAAVPPTAWTTPEPAKSMTPLRKASGLPTDSHPASHHTQWTTTG